MHAKAARQPKKSQKQVSKVVKVSKISKRSISTMKTAAPVAKAMKVTSSTKASPMKSFARMMSDYTASYQQDPKAVEARVFDVLKGFDKVNQEKLSTQAKFHQDLGLDSLDRVEVMLAIEEEFNVEFSDEQSDKFSSVFEVVDHLAKKPDIHLRTFRADDV